MRFKQPFQAADMWLLQDTCCADVKAARRSRPSQVSLSSRACDKLMRKGMETRVLHLARAMAEGSFAKYSAPHRKVEAEQVYLLYGSRLGRPESAGIIAMNVGRNTGPSVALPISAPVSAFTWRGGEPVCQSKVLHDLTNQQASLLAQGGDIGSAKQMHPPYISWI